MVDRVKDTEEQALATLFASPPIDDDGFSRRVERRVRRRIWVRRLAMPAAVLVGGVVAFEPLVTLFAWLRRPADMLGFLPTMPAELPAVLFGGILLAVAALMIPMLED